MPCPRCAGFLVYLTCWDHAGAYVAVRCVNCGYYNDTGAMRNRRNRPATGWFIAGDGLGKAPFHLTTRKAVA